MLTLAIVATSLFSIWYFCVIKPQAAMRKKALFIQKNLDIGATIVTSSGIQGTVIFLNQKIVIIKNLDGALHEVLKWTITEIIRQQ